MQTTATERLPTSRAALLSRLEKARVRTLSVIKSRGMPHSSATQEFAITNKGIVLKAPLRSQATP